MTPCVHPVFTMARHPARMSPDSKVGPHAQDQCAAGLAHTARQLHDEFDARLGPRAVEECIAEVAGRFAHATVLSFVPLLVRRYAREELLRRPVAVAVDLREPRPEPALVSRAD
jgi:hypothetical protein